MVIQNSCSKCRGSGNIKDPKAKWYKFYRRVTCEQCQGLGVVPNFSRPIKLSPEPPQEMKPRYFMENGTKNLSTGNEIYEKTKKQRHTHLDETCKAISNKSVKELKKILDDPELSEYVIMCIIAKFKELY